MTQVTLRQGHKLVEKINGRLNTITITPTRSVNIWEVTDAAAIFKQASSEVNNEITREMNLKNARADIRDSIRVVNALAVDDLVAKRKRTLDVIASLRQLQTTGERGVSSAEALDKKLIATREAAKATTRSYGDNDTITISVFTQEQIKDLDKQIQELQLEIEKIEDALTTANASGKISLGEMTLKVLKDEGLF